MPYLSSLERFLWEKGYRQGFKEGLLEALDFVLELKAGKAGKRPLLKKLQAIDDLDELRALTRAIVATKNPDAINELLGGTRSITRQRRVSSRRRPPRPTLIPVRSPSLRRSAL
jgi:hypothetical protein